MSADVIAVWQRPRFLATSLVPLGPPIELGMTEVPT